MKPLKYLELNMKTPKYRIVPLLLLLVTFAHSLYGQATFRDLTVTIGGGGSAPVGTVVATGTPSAGDLLSSADGSRTNAVWSAPLWSTNTTFDVNWNYFFTNYVMLAAPDGHSYVQISTDGIPARVPDGDDLIGDAGGALMFLLNPLDKDTNETRSALYIGGFSSTQDVTFARHASNFVSYATISTGNGADLMSIRTDQGKEAVFTGSVSGLGLLSRAVDSPVAISSTGWTNSFGKNAVVSMIATGATWVKYNNAGTPVSTNGTVYTGPMELSLQSAGAFAVTAGTVSGVGNPF